MKRNIIKTCVLGVGLLTLASCDDPMDELTSLVFDRVFSPVDLEARSISENSADLQWTPSEGAGTYTVEVFADDSLTFEGDIYDRITDGILYKAPVYATIGSKSAPYQNLCQVTNKGFELSIGWKDTVKDFSYGISGNFSRNWNAVTKYNGALQAGWVTDENGHRHYSTNIGDVSTGTTQRVMEGKIINEYSCPVY